MRGVPLKGQKSADLALAFYILKVGVFYTNMRRSKI